MRKKVEIDLITWAKKLPKNVYYCLLLNTISTVKKSVLFKLLTRYSPEQLFNLSENEQLILGFNDLQRSELSAPNSASLVTSLNWLNSSTDNYILCYNSPQFPSQLQEISSCPFLLYLQGNITLLSRVQLSIIGSRNCTIYGEEKAYEFAKKLSLQGYVITSGLAIGIDGFAHKGALSATGETIAVLGSGLEQIYPKRHTDLAKEVRKKGLLVSEFWPDSPPLPKHFPRRNRIISGLSTGVLVVEASKKSGSLITARYAMEQNREVFALPGSIDNAVACGCHQLIQSGAKLITCVKDISDEFPYFSVGAEETEKSLTKNCEKAHPLLAYIDFHVTNLEQLLERSGLPLITLQNQLIDLEINGIIVAVPEGYMKLKG